MQINQTQNPFFYQPLLSHYVSKAKFQIKSSDGLFFNSNINHKKQTLSVFNQIRHPSDYFAIHQTQHTILLCFSFSFINQNNLNHQFINPQYSKSKLYQPQQTDLNNKSQIKSTVTFYAFDKESSQIIKNYSLKPMNTQITSLCFTYSNLEKCQEKQLLVLIGTADGRIKIISIQNDQSIYVQTMQISFYKVHKIIKSPWTNVCMILLSNSTVMMVNYVQKKIILEASNNCIQLDMPISIKLHYSNKYFIATSKIGAINLWKIDQNSLQIMLKNQQKVFFIKPHFQISSLSKHGLIWCDFIGNFFGIIGESQFKNKFVFKIVAINITISKKDVQHFETISISQINKNQGQIISYVQNFPEKRSIMICFKGKKTSRVEVYHFNEFYQIKDITTIDVGSQRMKQFRISSDLQYFFVRESQCFKIFKQKNIFKEAILVNSYIQENQIYSMFYESETNCSSNF